MKRKAEAFCRGERLKSPMKSILLLLDYHHLLPHELVAVDLFGMYGLWNTYDIYGHCKYLEMWDINPLYCKYAKKFIPSATVMTGDSIKAVQDNKLLKPFYNLIILDNPSGIYANDYCEHFDLFPRIYSYIDQEGIIIMNLVLDVHDLSSRYSFSTHVKDAWIMKRKEFYQCDNVDRSEPNQLIKAYIDNAERNGFKTIHHFLIPRTKSLGFLTLYLKK